jgi:hypothetical protein
MDYIIAKKWLEPAENAMELAEILLIGQKMHYTDRNTTELGETQYIPAEK